MDPTAKRPAKPGARSRAVLTVVASIVGGYVGAMVANGLGASVGPELVIRTISGGVVNATS